MKTYYFREQPSSFTRIANGHQCYFPCNIPFPELATVNVNREDNIVNLLGRMDEYRRYYQIDIRQCFYDGSDCRIYDLRTLGHKLKNEEDEVDEEDEQQSSVPTDCVSDSPEVEEESLQALQEQQHIAAREQAGGIRRWWGRVFKKRDQDPKISKTKLQVCVSGDGGLLPSAIPHWLSFCVDAIAK
jgi:hypothetical protein